MGRPLSTASKELVKTPCVQVRGEKGQFFVGTLVDHKSSKSKKYVKDDGSPKVQHVFEFAIQDTDMEIQISNDKGEYVEASVGVGDTVAVFPPTRLLNALLEAQKGETIRFEYLGLGKAGKRGGKPHEYKVEVI